ncbi:unnamed protein product [Bathycoccus prasinos]
MPVPSTEVRIVDEAGNILSQGEMGEIQVKGPQVMKGYYNRPEAAADTIKEGWLSTGDIVSGFNVYPNEIEDFIATHEKVLEVAAIGVEDEKSGEHSVRKVLQVIKVPKHIEFKDELPKTNVGKILRRALRESN